MYIKWITLFSFCEEKDKKGRLHSPKNDKNYGKVAYIKLFQLYRF